MIDEEMRSVDWLRTLASGKGFASYLIGAPEEAKAAADLIEQLSAELERAVAENKKLRQTTVTHEIYKQVMEELDKVKRELDAGWISVCDRMPYEHDSFFSMFHKTSDQVLVAVENEQGEKVVVPAFTMDGKWTSDIFRAEKTRVTHWMPFPSAPCAEIGG